MVSTDWRGEAGRSPDDGERRAFLAERRASHAMRLSALAPRYDDEWGAIPPSHDRFVRRLLDLTRPVATILDAACGTGRFWPHILEGGRTVIGLDQSPGMLAEAARKHPDVPVGRVGLQELPFEGLFDATMCVDAIENVGPEDWPPVLARLRQTVKVGGHLYLTVEVADEAEVRQAYERARALGAPVVPGEDFDGVGYHYYPTREAVDRWLAEAGLQTIADEEADFYRHLLLRRSE